MKKILFLLSILLISNVLAINIDDVTQGDEVIIYLTCNNCTYVNFTKVINPNDAVLISNIEAVKDGTYYSYNLSGGNTTILGTYTYCYDAGNTAERKTGCVDFEVTPSGNSGSAQIVFSIFIILMIYGITFISFFYGRNIPMTVLGGMCMMFLGVYIIRQGLIIFRDNLTVYFSYVTIGAGAIMTFWALLEQFEVI